MKPRTSVRRSAGNILIIIDGVQHSLSVPSFLTLLQQTQPVLAALARERAAADT